MPPKSPEQQQITKLKGLLKKKQVWDKCNLRHMGLGSAGVQAIASIVPRFAQIEELLLSQNAIGDLGLERLKPVLDPNGPRGVKLLDLDSNEFEALGTRYLRDALSKNQTLKELHISKNPIGNDGIQACAELLQKATPLEILIARKTGLTQEAGEILRDAYRETTIQLRTLDISENSIGPYGAEYLAEALPDSQLEYLLLYQAEIGPRGATALANALKLGRSRLTKLDVCNNGIGDEGAKAFASALEVESCSLELLSLSHNQIDISGAEALGASLKRNDRLTEFRLGTNDMGAEGVRHLAEALQVNATLTGLYVRHNDIGVKGAQALGESFGRMRGLKRLGLQGNGIGDAGAVALSTGLVANDSIIALELDRNEIGDVGASAIAGAVERRPQFETLLLARNMIQDAGAQEIARVLRSHEGLLHIGLQKNNIDWEGAIPLVEALGENPSLQEFHLDGNWLYMDGAQRLSDVVQGRTSLRTLDISCCYLGALGAAGLHGLLSNPNQCLQRLYLGSNELCDGGAWRIANALQNNKHLIELRLHRNKIGDDGALALAETLRSTKLQCVDLDENLITDAAAVVSITDADAVTLARAISEMKELGEFGLKGNPITQENKLKEASWKNALEFKKSPPKIRLGAVDPVEIEEQQEVNQ